MHNSKKILFVITKAGWGGAQRYVRDMAKAMRDQGYQVKVAAGAAGILAERLADESLPFREIYGMDRDMRLLSADVPAFFSLLRTIREEKPNILHLNSSKAGGMGAVLGRLLSVPLIVFTAHGWPTRERRFFLSRFLIVFFSWLTAVFAHKVICVSEADFREASHWPFLKKKLVMIHNGISVFEQLPRETAQGELGIEHPEAWQLGTNAELNFNKNLSSAIKAVSLYNQKHEKKIEYTIVGSGLEKKELERLIEKEGVSAYVHLAGFHNNAATLLSAFDAFILPSHKEGLPLALLEAGLAGLPSIATKTGGIPEIIEDGETGLLVAHPEPAAIEAALTKLFADYSPELGIRLKEKILRNFSLEEAVEETIRVYETKIS